MRSDDVRTLALALPDSIEQDHHGFPSFRTEGRIFATLPDDEHVHVMLDPEDIRSAVRTHPGLCEELWWGKKLAAVRVTLPDANEELVQDLLLDAWERLHADGT